MLASVFIMQPLGQAAAYIVCIVALAGLDAQYHFKNETDPRIVAPIADKLWRWVTGLGAIPAVIAIVFRLTIPESGRFTLDVQDDADRAILETTAHYGTEHPFPLDGPEDPDLELELQNIESHPDSNAPNGAPHYELPKQFSRQDLFQYFIAEGNWRYLAATSLCWFFLDFAYFGLQINNPRFLSRLWASGPPANSSSVAPCWLSEASNLSETLSITTITTITNATSSQPNNITYSHPPIQVYSTTLYDVLMTNAKMALVSISIGSLIGSALLIKVINYLPRKRFLVWSFLGLAILTAATGVSFHYTFRQSAWGVTLLLYILCQVFFNLGPNSLTFIIPAEIFPTRYRATCHGLSAAAGKLASVIVQVTLPVMKFDGVGIRDLNSKGMGWVLIIFGGVLALGAPFAWAWLPEVQRPRDSETGLILPSRTLEELAEGRKGETGEHTGFRRRAWRLIGRDT
jgi:MFS transporter, PHS family, inorganic phosphate transporter